MKKIIFAFFAFFAFWGNAQSYEPTTKWPYIYKNFQEGTIYLKNNEKTNLNMNIHLLANDLHYVKDDLICYVENSGSIDSVKIGTDKYIYTKFGFLKVIGQSHKAKLLLMTKGDFESLSGGTGAYGSVTQTSAVTNLSSIYIGGISNRNYRQLIIEKEDSKILPVNSAYFYAIDDNIVKATKKDLKNFLSPIAFQTFEVFLKNNKIKWNDEDSLLKLLSYFK